MKPRARYRRLSLHWAKGIALVGAPTAQKTTEYQPSMMVQTV